jgi:D-glycero-D-manno-heptose 1,7-bisphosphate phosphatase
VTIASIQQALFLDRDGVININHGYVHCQKDFEFIDGIFDLARAAHSLQYKLVVITNQAGIGRGYYSVQQFLDLTDWMSAQFLAQGAPISKVYYSPYHPSEGVGVYKKDDFSRKPNPGMIFQAQKEFNLDLEGSFLVGDKASDIQAGAAAGVGHNILFSPDNPIELSSLDYRRISFLKDVLPMLSSSQYRKIYR